MRGISIESSVLKFKHQKREFTITDTPGDEDYIKNMIASMTLNDAAILIIDARFGRFEDGIKRGG